MRQPALIALLLIAAGPAFTRAEEVGELSTRLDAAVAAQIAGGLGPAADDATFLRRSWLDLTGHVPPALFAREFLDDRAPDKRTKMVDRLLDSDEYADHWGRVVAEWLIAERPIHRDGYDGRVLHAYLRDGFRRHESYGRLVRELLTGTGASDASGPANFLLRYDAEPTKLAGAVGKGVLGVSIQCAQCHDHPFSSWSQDDFWGLAATFARLRRMESDTGDDLKAVVETRKGELTRPDLSPPPASVAVVKPEGAESQAPPAPKEIVVKPKRPDGKPIPAGASRREALAEWIVAPDNPYFARNVANRAWGQLFGRSPLRNLDTKDGKFATTPVLDLLAADFTANGQDLRRMVRIVVLSKAYAQASFPRATPAWTRPTARPLSVDQLYASIAQATGHDGPPAADAPEAAPADDDADDHEAEVETAEEGIRPAEDDDAEPGTADQPVELLGERALTLQRALVLINGTFIRDAAQSAVRVARAAHGGNVGAEHVEWAFLSTLSRRPTLDERKILEPVLGMPARPKGLEDALWVILNSVEFQTNH